MAIVETARYPMNKRRDSSADAGEIMFGGPVIPRATGLLIVANVIIFAAMLINGAGLWHSPNDVQIAWGAGFGPATRDGEWWRLGSAMFLHFGIAHLGINAIALWESGRLVERLFGPARFTAIYFVSGIAGNLASLMIAGDRAVSGGASGAIFGLYGALLSCLWRERKRMHAIHFRWMFGGTAILAAAMIALGLLIQGIDNAAHIGGFIGGSLIGTVLFRPFGPERETSRNRLIAAGILVMATLTMLMNVPPPNYRWEDEKQAREAVRSFLIDEQRISERWQSILETGNREGASFDELADRIDSDVARGYRESFEQLSELNVRPTQPSAMAVDILRKYTKLRSEAAHSFAEGLRTQDENRIREAAEFARQASDLARSSTPQPQIPERQNIPRSRQ
jgi:rhomboid protease GluP